MTCKEKELKMSPHTSAKPRRAIAEQQIDASRKKQKDNCEKIKKWQKKQTIIEQIWQKNQQKQKQEGEKHEKGIKLMQEMKKKHQHQHDPPTKTTFTRKNNSKKM